VGFDINKERVEALQKGHDATLEVEDNDLQAVLTADSNADKGLFLTDSRIFIQDCNHYVVTVPTPIDKNKRPDLTPLIKASETVGKMLSKGDIVIYESTVHPGATEDDCVPVLEKHSGLVFNKDFYCGYSPERINPGDKVNTLTTTYKITSGSTPEVAEKIDQLYKVVVKKGTFKASCIKVAEAAKVVENAQRDINIAFANELAKICNLLDIDSNEVVDAMNTKWNALGFRPGLVGGHCIGIDPYYLTDKAQELGYHPEIILAGRRLNDDMGHYVADQIVKLMIRKGQTVLDSKVLILGITFKENCPDIRNSRVIDVIEELRSFGCNVSVYDPWADPKEVKEEYGVDLVIEPGSEYDTIVAAVAHRQFKEIDLKALINGPTSVIYDIKGMFDAEMTDGRL